MTFSAKWFDITCCDAGTLKHKILCPNARFNQIFIFSIGPVDWSINTVYGTSKLWAIQDKRPRVTRVDESKHIATDIHWRFTP